MSLDLSMCRFTGPALPEPFVRFELEKELKDLLPKAVGESGRELAESWEAYRRYLRELVSQGGPLRVRNTVVEPLAKRLGYGQIEDAGEVATREGQENGGFILMNGADRLRVWTTALGEDLDAPVKRGHAYRFGHLRIAQRVLLATNERVGLLTNGVELRILISDPARTDSQIEIPIESHWKRSRDVPDSYRLVLALCSPAGLKALPDLIEKARLKQTGVTKELRKQARQAVELFVQGLLSNSVNQELLRNFGRTASPEIETSGSGDTVSVNVGSLLGNDGGSTDDLAKQLWHEGLINIFRLLFVLKMESIDDPARAFSFASSSLWRNTYSPTVALGPVVRAVVDKGTETGQFLESSLRALYRMFTEGLACAEINVKPLGGALFGENATPLISRLHWSERCVADLLDGLLWTPKTRGSDARERVHYGPLTVQDLGRVYESLIELEPGITMAPMCRLRRRKLEVVVPLAQGEKYRSEAQGRAVGPSTAADPDEADADADDDNESGRAKKTTIDWIEEIPAGRFFLRVGLGRKASGSYYTPDSFVKFLVQETLGPLCAERSPEADPQPGKLLELKVADIAMGSGHFLFEACEFLGAKLYEACRLCDELAMVEEGKDEQGGARPPGAPPSEHIRRALELRQRVQYLPDPNDELMAYLPSRAPEDGLTAYSVGKAQALCKRLVAVHCLYGVDLNPLAVELAKLSLWIETHAEGMPLTFLDHRFVVGNSLTGPFFDQLLKFPGTQEPMDDLFAQGLKAKFNETLQAAMLEVRDLESTVGVSLGEIEAKKAAKARMDQLLAPFKLVAAAWTGGVMLGSKECDDQVYLELVKAVAQGKSIVEKRTSRIGSQATVVELADNVTKLQYGANNEEDSKTLPSVAESRPVWLTEFDMPASLAHMIDKGKCTIAFDFVFPDAFFGASEVTGRAGFDVVLGNPPWDRIRPFVKEFFATYDIGIMDTATEKAQELIIHEMLADDSVRLKHEDYEESFASDGRVHDALYRWQEVQVGDIWAGRGNADAYCLFAERSAQVIKKDGAVGLVVPSAFHANEGATGIRRLYLDEMSLRCCYSFENRRKLFDIHASFKFALIVAVKSGPTESLPCAFYLHDDAWLFGERTGHELKYSHELISKTGGDYLTFIELRSQADAVVAGVCYGQSESFRQFVHRCNIDFGVQADVTRDRHRFCPADDVISRDVDCRTTPGLSTAIKGGFLVLHEGKTFWQFDDAWGDRPRYCLSVQSLSDKASWINAARYYRLAYRSVASATNERTAIFSILPAGVVLGNSAPGNRHPDKTPKLFELVLAAMANSYPFDWTIRVRAGSNINQFILFSCPIPPVRCWQFMRSAALRLTANHAGYLSLWTEQLGDEWREPIPKHTWPVLSGVDDQWMIRATIDAVVADAYGLTKDQYTHVLSTFSHKSYPKAPALCLDRFDELKSIGLDAFTKKHDPYWDIPLNENLPKPVIELSGLALAEGGIADGSAKKRRGRKAKPSVVVVEAPDFGPLFRAI